MSFLLQEQLSVKGFSETWPKCSSGPFQPIRLFLQIGCPCCGCPYKKSPFVVDISAPDFWKLPQKLFPWEVP